MDIVDTQQKTMVTFLTGQNRPIFGYAVNSDGEKAFNR